ncbi:DUF2207 domain-containing protein [Fusobacterium periodonticum]|uniref:DUF2207 domain-containing protein n=4 Tax=Fusobacterium TaxID=848 RepID=K1HBF2_9FUSO|nr:DUF2207 domain-containing protein [Fusobacterium periodonticum]AVQ24735.1 DUF2207 domain-containing protein [Fusobacterium periodonticum]EKA92813.1 hypothetical protein FPOG_01406 [Fusobacterium periodonticum D10]KGE63088.1 hypothetical protein FSAG_000775 [Fusobacterium periodonticum 2_1_31]
MKKNILRIFLFFLISIVSFAASFRIEKLDIEANLQKDGSMVVSEAVTYDIDEINGVYFDIDAKGFGELEYIQVFEDDSTGGFKEVDSSNYEVSVSDELYRIKLYSKNHNNRRTFKFVYKLPEAITVYDDVAQFNRKMVGQEWQQGINYITAKVIIPVSASYDNSNILVFGHGPLTGEVDKEGNTVVYKLNNYYPGDFLEAHILMEPEIFSEYNKSKIVHKDMKQKLLDMEAKLADEANAERDKAIRQQEMINKVFEKPGLIFGVLSSIWGALMYYIHVIFKRKNKVKNSVGKYLRELPDNSSPALVGGFMTNSINDNEILATIVDLVRRKVLTLENSDKNSIIILTGSTENLSAQEKAIVDIYINDFGDGKSLDLKSFGFFQKVPMSVARKFEKWRAMVQSEMDRKNLTYQGLGCLGVIFFAFFPMIFTFAGLVIGMITGNKMFLLIVVMGIILFVSGAKARYPRKELAEAKDKWQAFKNFLSDYSQLEEAKITSVHLWEQYFVYAVALGVSEKVVKAYKKALDMGVINDVQGVNSLAYSPIFNPMFSRSFSNLNGMVSRTNSGASSAIASSRRSSSSGGGGGFSSHSSGGGGSRGGGGGF